MSSGRIAKAFADCRSEGRAAFVAYITAGDPTLSRTEELVPALSEAGADIIELGVPFSDPTADGVVNQEAAERALASGTTLPSILESVKRLRSQGEEVPLVLFTYVNPIFAYGKERFAADARDAGVDGILLVDLPAEEAPELKPDLDQAGIDTIFLVAPTTDESRLASVVDACSGFVYYVSRTGVTGVRDDLDSSVSERVQEIKKKTSLPVAVGFGISSPDHVKTVAKLADGVIVGSAIVRKIGEIGDSEELVPEISSLVRRLTSPLRAGQ